MHALGHDFIDTGLFFRPKAYCGFTDLCRDAAIFVWFPVYPFAAVMQLNLLTEANGLLSFQPHFGCIALNGRKTRWLPHDKGLYVGLVSMEAVCQRLAVLSIHTCIAPSHSQSICMHIILCTNDQCGCNFR
jgi:hypothetical protein